jgi:1-acyl-sn-glycerol-3-phosphate acyltransferase
VRDRAYRWIVAIGTAFLWAMDVRRTVRGAEHLPRDGGAVLAISHFSYLDFVLSEWAVWRHRRRCTRFLATQAAFDHRLTGPLMSAMGHIPVERGAGTAAYVGAVDALRRGELVGVFPEGRVSGTFTLLPFKTGAARMAAESGCPIVPCVIWGSHRIMTRTHRTPLRRARRTPVQVLIGKPIPVGPHEDPDVVTARLRQTMIEMLEEAMDTDALEPGAWWVPAHRGGGAPAPDTTIETDERKAS